MLEKIDLSKKADKETCRQVMEQEGERLARLQRECKAAGIPVMIVFEGMGAAGKGVQINRLVQALDPRGFSVYASNSSSEEERMRPFLWRFWIKTPANGRIAIFDRSWYGRVMVERLEGFCSENDWRRAFTEMNEFEHTLTEWGAVVIKFWLHIDKDEQLARFTLRQQTPEKQWKITDEDWRNREKWDQYEVAVNDMLKYTSTDFAPWNIIESNNKKFARIKALKIIIRALEDRLRQ